MPNKTTLNDIFEKIEKTESCWIWRGNIDHKGYGRISQKKTHRWSYEFYKGPIPKGYVVRHKCDNPPCLNPDHLEIGTRADNNRDRHERKRSKSDKLTILQALDIKYNLRAKDAIKKYPFVSETTITRIRTGKIWKHI